MTGPTLSVETRLALRVGANLCAGATLLEMTNDDLGRHIERQAARNPFLRVAGRSHTPPANPPNGQEAVSGSESLYAHVLTQIGLTISDDTDRHLAMAFVDALEPSGWLSRTVSEISRDAGVSRERADAVLARLQSVEPTGLFARDLADCLRLQLAERDALTAAVLSVLDNLDVILDGGIDAIVRNTGLSHDVIDEALCAIRACDPKPGAAFDGPDMTLQRRPDILVSKDANGWHVELNGSTLPKVSVSLPDPAGRADKDMDGFVADARTLINAVRRRNKMMLDVARCVIGHQTGFLERGVRGLKPLRRVDVASRLDVHESTVSRAAKGLLVQTPREVTELSRFFSRALDRESGLPVSRRRIQDQLKRLIASEDCSQPLSDQALAARLADRGARVSRRTVAKYRLALGHGCAHERRTGETH